MSSSFLPGPLPPGPPLHVSSSETPEEPVEEFYFNSSANMAFLARYAHDLRRFRRWQDASVQGPRCPNPDRSIGVNEVLDYPEFEASRLSPMARGSPRQ